jgi:hypothetical protein
MGYDLKITRAPMGLERNESPISLDEWLEYVASDPEFRLDNVAEVCASSGQVLRYENPGLAVWLPSTLESGSGRWFDFRNGRIVVKNPTDEMIAKMKQVANRLNARVVGDDGEEY